MASRAERDAEEATRRAAVRRAVTSLVVIAFV